MLVSLNFVLLLYFSFISITSSMTQNEIKSLPGITFDFKFKQYSGYLNGNSIGTYKLFYWLVESQGNSSQDPLILWLNGGPGCSSLGGFFTELGPFHPNPDKGSTLYENIFSWNKVGNFLFLESPPGVGFSYADDGRYKWTDNLTAEMNYHALFDFFSNSSEFKDRDFYLTGESYSGVYIPTLARLLIEGIQNKTFPNRNFKGVAIGNGVTSEEALVNSVVNYMYYHGVVGVDFWSKIKLQCCGKTCGDDCNFYAHVQRRADGFDWNSDFTECGNLTYHVAQTILNDPIQDPYNIYQDCYKDLHLAFKRSAMPTVFKFVDSARQFYHDSTDPFRGFPCWMDNNTFNYLNRKDIWDALGIDQTWRKNVGSWQDCNDKVYYNFEAEYHTLEGVYDDILTSGFNISILIYSGDVDSVCNFLGTSWFWRDLTKKHKIGTIDDRKRWYYREQIAGFVQQYEKNIDVLTVKGSGHFVPTDRPGPALQMLCNYIHHTADYSKETGLDLAPKSLLPKYNGETTTTSNAESSGLKKCWILVGILIFILIN